MRLPLDVMLVASANPEDYTNRGRMITPLKDRFGAQIRTHYPLEISTEIDIAKQEARIPTGTPTVSIPEFMHEIIATFTHLARSSAKINQRSGVSVRLTVSNLETLAAAATARALRLGESETVPRVSELDALIASTAGKVEVEALDEGREGEVIDHLLSRAVVEVFKESVSPEHVRAVVDAFDEDLSVSAGDDIPVANYIELLTRVPAMASPVMALVGEGASQAAQASAIELILEGLHLSRRLNKDQVGTKATYRART